MESPDFTVLFVKMLALLAVIIVLAFFLLRYLSPARRRGAKGLAAHFDLLGTYRIDHRKAVYLVRIGKRHFALGGGEQGLSVITELNAGDLEE